MKKALFLALMTSFLCYCKKEQVADSNSSIIEGLLPEYRQGELTRFLELLQYEENGSILMSHYNYNFSRHQKYSIIGTFEPVMNVYRVKLNQEVIPVVNKYFQHDDDLLEAGLQEGASIPNYFNTNLEMSLLTANNSILLTSSLAIPAALVFDIAEQNPIFQPGTMITWNAAPENTLGLYLIFEYAPAGNLHLGENLSEEKQVWYINIPDTGSYTFSQADFPSNLPEESVVGMRAIRATYKDSSTPNGNFRFVAHSEVHGLFVFRR
ncbi:MAG TPA: hypothetical protein PKA00_17570 [Saprospiraceae bacterium]|nr:hypothetical protein [Saprospiraceae bacterium]HMQ84731.1 hypothetical protein [Saprospiraceae bacterium]